MKRFYSIVIVFSFLFIFGSAVKAEGQDVKIEPDIPKHDTEALFEEEKEFDSRELVIKFRNDATNLEKEAILKGFHVKKVDSQKVGNYHLVSVPKGTDLQLLADKFLKNKQVEYVEPNYEIESQYKPKDPKYSKQWYLKKLNMPKAWDISKGAAHVTVAVVDGGVQTNHPDLTGKIVKPYNAVTGGTTYPVDDHGTHVAGIIAATINKTGISGISPNVKIMPVNVFEGDFADSFIIADGITYAADSGADIINLSLGSYYYSSVIDSAISYAASKGIVVIAAAGNDDTNYKAYPAANDHVLGISATTKYDKITWFSNYGKYIDFSAPGEDIYSTVSRSRYDSYDGTSMASPVVAGVTALILSKNPYLSPSQVTGILKSSSVDLGKKKWDHFYGYGRVDAYRALSKTPAPMSSVSSSKALVENGKNKASISFTAPKGKTVSLYVQNSKGTVVRKLITNKVWTGGKVSASWNGKLDNGAYAGSGTYKIVAKVSHPKGTVYRTSSIKVTEKIKPDVAFSSSSTAYSPAVKANLSTSFHLNKSAKVSAAVYDARGKLVRTVWSNKSLSGGKRYVDWNGKDSKGYRVKDGIYYLKLNVIDSKKVKGKTKSYKVTIDTTTNGSISNTSQTYKLDGNNKSAARINLTEKSYLTVTVLDYQGKAVKQVISNKAYNAGTHTVYWDGKTSINSYSKEGNYSFLVEVRDSLGNKKSFKSSIFKIEDLIKPRIAGPNSAAVRSENPANISYTLLKAGNVEINIYKGSELVKTIMPRTAKPAGTFSFTWNGLDNSDQPVEDGAYTYQVKVSDPYNSETILAGTMNVALTVGITNPTSVPYYPEEQILSEVFYKLSNPAKVTVDILDQNGAQLANLVTNEQLEAGIQSFKLDRGLVIDPANDFLVYRITAVNAFGQTATSDGKLVKDIKPNWLTQEIRFIEDSVNKRLEVDATLLGDGEAKLLVYDNGLDLLNDGTAIESKVFPLADGLNHISDTKPLTSNLHYKIVYTNGSQSYSFMINEDNY
ncbi:S8 family serine peptidase [Bacillus sp. V59.32b]|uniref:S8 family serine peptidase n=1 Tax=Bacillus sp. V59.32b TaxID=1758642 RepID=UPI000E3DC7BA|nr:S8 family serine peptidase [Bacillus sp. V59.32b]RFU66833.1 hypothetical protein D0463_08815 [Bacillus sp. V59.32b]